MQCDGFAADTHPEWIARNPDGTTVGGASVAADASERDFAPGDTWVETQLQVPHHRLWELNDPVLYPEPPPQTLEHPLLMV